METISRNLDSLLAFHVVALEKSFSQAALTLGTSKAMVSKQVKQLETYLRTQLFTRTTRRVSLTNEGLALFAYSQKIFTLSDEATKKLRDISESATGPIKLTAPVSIGEAFFPAILAEFRKSIPGTEIEIDLSNEARDLNEHHIDFAIRASESHAPDLIARPLGRIRDVICVSSQHLEDLRADPKNLKDPRDLAKLNCIMNARKQAWNTWTFNRGTMDTTVEIKGAFAANQYSMARKLCLQGFGIAKVPYYLVADDLADGQLIQLFKDYSISTHPLYLVYTRSEFSSRRKQLIRDSILNWFKRNRSAFE